jgi:hypothetical protein
VNCSIYSWSRLSVFGIDLGTSVSRLFDESLQDLWPLLWEELTIRYG